MDPLPIAMDLALSFGLLLGMVGAVLFRIPNVPIPRFRRFVYRHSPIVNHYQDIEGIFEIIRNITSNEKVIIYSDTEPNNIPYKISEKPGGCCIVS